MGHLIKSAQKPEFPAQMGEYICDRPIVNNAYSFSVNWKVVKKKTQTAISLGVLQEWDVLKISY